MWMKYLPFMVQSVVQKLSWILLVIPLVVIAAIIASAPHATPVPSRTPALLPVGLTLTATPSYTPTRTKTPLQLTRTSTRTTPTLTPIPLGRPGNPLVISFISEKLDPVVRTNAGLVAAQLAKLTGFTIESEISPNYQWTFKGMQEGAVHMAWLPPLTYIYAQKQGNAQVVLLASHYGVYTYSTQFLANASSGFRKYYDSDKMQTTSPALVSLLQFKGKTPCWAEMGSPSGYLVPLGLLMQNNISVNPGVYTNSPTAVIRALYIKGICDFGVTYANSGDPRTSSAVQQDLPDVIDKVGIIWMSDTIIPNLNFSVLPDLPENVRVKLIQGMLDLVKTDDGKKNLSAANAYDIQNLKPVEDSLYNPLRKIVEITGADLSTFLGK
jgi:phosphonate transport system substrate-binding protein